MSRPYIPTSHCHVAERDEVDVFVDTVFYEFKSPETCLLKPRQTRKGRLGKTVEFAPPLEEFRVLLTRLVIEGFRARGLGLISLRMIIRRRVWGHISPSAKCS